MSFSGMEAILAHELNYDLGSMNKETSFTVTVSIVKPWNGNGNNWVITNWKFILAYITTWCEPQR